MKMQCSTSRQEAKYSLEPSKSQLKSCDTCFNVLTCKNIDTYQEKKIIARDYKNRNSVTRRCNTN